MNRFLSPRRILAGTILSLLTLAPLGTKAETFNATLEGGPSAGTATYLWTTAPWSIPGEYPGFDDFDDAVTILFREFNNVDATGNPIVNVDLEGGAYTLGSLTLNESGTGETVGNFQNGTFNLSSISHTGAGNTVTFTASTTIHSGATQLNLSQSAGFRSLVFAGNVTGTGGTLANMTDVNGRVIFNQATYGVTGGLTMTGVGNLRFDQFASGTTKTIDSLNFSSTGELELDRVTGTTGYTFAVSGATNVNSSRMRLLAIDSDGEFIFNGATTVDNNGAGVELATNNQRAFVRINAALNDSGEGDRLRLAPHLITNSNSGNFGTVFIGSGVTTNRTGETDFFTTGVLGDNFRGMGGKVVLNAVSAAGTGLGPGQVNVGNDISLGNHLNVAVNHGAGLDVDLKAFNVISGDLTGAVYAQTGTAGDEVAIGAGDRIFVNGTLGLPTTAVTGGATHYLGIPATNGTFTVGDDANPATTNDIFKGAAFGATISTTLSSAFSGTVSTFSGSANLPVVVLGQIFGQGGTATFNTTGAVTFTGPGAMILDEPSAAGITRAVNLDVINRVGNLESQNNNIVILSDTSALGAGQTVNASFGRVDLNNAAGAQAGSTVVAGEMATISLDLAATSGAFTIGQGGMMLLAPLANTEGGATFNVTGTNAAVILNAEGAVGTQLAALMPQVDLIIGGVFGVDDFDGAGLKLGPGKRLSLARDVDTSTLTGGTGITTTAVAGETVYISATPSRTFDINDSVTLGAANLEIGSAAPITTIVAQGNVSRFTAAHNGIVNLDGNTTAHNVTVQGGTVNFVGNGAVGTANFSGAFALNAGAVALISDNSPAELNLIDGTFAAGGVRVNDGGRFEIEFDQQSTGVNVLTPFILNGNAASSLSGVNLIVDENGIATGTNAALFNLNDVRLTNGSVLAVDEQGTVTVRAAIRVAGTGTLVDSVNADDIDLLSVSGIDANGATDNVGAKILVLGDTALASETFNTTLAGTIAPNVTVQVRNAVLTLGPGATVNGTLNYTGRTGPDPDIFITAGQNGTNFVAGTGQIDLSLGEDVETFVDEVDAGDPPNGALAPVENIVGLRINVLAGETGVLRSNRGFNAADATDIFGAVTYTNVHLAAGSVLSLSPASSIALRAGLVLDGDASLSATDGTRSYIGSLSDPGLDNTLTITGVNVRLVGPASAKAIVIGGAISGTLNIHPSDLQTQTVTTANGTGIYPLLPGTRVAPSLDLSDALVVGLGGLVNFGVDNVADGAYTVSTGLRLSDNADINIYTPVVIPAGKSFEGSSSIAVLLDDSSAADTGALRIDGTISPGSAAAPAGTLSLQDGLVTMADGSTYKFQAGVDALSGDLVRITGTSSQLIFGGAWTLELGATSDFDPTGKTFVLFDAATTIAGLGTPTVVNLVPGWAGNPIVAISGNDVVLTGLIPEPGSAAMLLTGLGFLAARRQRGSFGVRGQA